MEQENQYTATTYLLHQSLAIFSRNPTRKPPFPMQYVSRCVLVMIADRAPDSTFTLMCPTSNGDCNIAQTKSTSTPIGCTILFCGENPVSEVPKNKTFLPSSSCTRSNCMGLQVRLINTRIEQRQNPECTHSHSHSNRHSRLSNSLQDLYL